MVGAAGDSGWVRTLQDFTDRNAGRRTVLEEDDPELGAQLEERARPLWGVSYDPRDGRVQVMLGRPGDETDHLTHTVRAESVEVLTRPDGRDQALRLRHGGGQTLLNLVD